MSPYLRDNSSFWHRKKERETYDIEDIDKDLDAKSDYYGKKIHYKPTDNKVKNEEEMLEI